MGLGTKADNLMKLKDWSYNVPDFEVLSADLYKEQIALDFISAIYDDIDFHSNISIEEASQKIQKYLLQHLPDFNVSFEREIYSVRSSTNLEDGKDYSFAGQFSTYLNVSDSDLNEYIIKCISTMYNPSSLIYVNKNNMNILDLEMNIIVQEMVNADYSGVIFSANPQGLLNELVIVCGKGTGDNVVEEKVDVTSYFYNKSDQTMYCVSQAESIKLTEAITSEILEITESLESKFGKYIDIEFCVKNSILYLLQVREITSIDDSNVTIYDNSNIVESYPGVCSPFTIEFAQIAYKKVFTSLMTQSIGASEADISPITSKMVGSNNGRMYYIISNWYELLLLLPFSKKIIPIWQEMLGVENKEYSKGTYKLSTKQKLTRNFNFIKFFFKSDRLMNKLNSDFCKIKEYFDNSYAESLSNEELIEIYNQLDNLLSSWYVTLINDMYAFIYTGLLKWYLKLTKVKDHENRANELIRSVNRLESMLPLIELSKIVDHIKENNLEEELRTLSEDTVKSYLQQNDSNFKKLVNDYIDNYGDRYFSELKLENETFRSNNYLLISRLLNYCETPVNIDSKKKEVDLKVNFISNRVIKFFQKRAVIGIAHRETSRLNRSRIFGMVRTLVLTMGRNLERDGQIDSARDIFYLTPSALLANNIDKQAIEKAKNQNKMFEQVPNYSRLVFASKPFNKQHSNIDGVPVNLGDGEIFGIPSSAGFVEGEVVVITDLAALNEVPVGKILVTKMTDPGWVFLLTSSIAVISEKGSLLSHTAIISRELGIPAIVAVNNITRLLKTGDRVSMDGTTGEIRIRNNVSDS